MDPERPRTAADLLAFADVRDIDEFIDGLRRFESGEWTPDQFRAFRLNRGAYGQRQPDVNMLRVKIPQGILTAAQLEVLAEVAERYSRGFGHVTTRQNVQFHFVKLAAAAEAMQRLAAVGLTTKEACGNTVRNVTACPLAGVCTGEAFDVTPYGQAISRHFLRRAENQQLPRKFKIALSGCSHDCGKGAINDVALLAKVEGGVPGFEVRVAGGLSTTPEDAHRLYEFVPADEVIPVIEAVIAVFDKHGNRQNKMRARLKYVLRRLGWEAFRAEIEKELADVQARVHGKVPIDAAAAEPLARSPSLAVVSEVQKAALGGSGGAAYERWRRTNVVAQKQAGFAAATVRLVRGDVTAAQLRGLARLARVHGDGLARTTIDQNLLVRFVPEGRLEALHAGLAALGLAEPDAHTILDVTACPGAESCNLAVTASRELASALGARLGADPAAQAARDLDLKISGCPNSCGQHHIAGIGFHGGIRRVGGRIVPEYTLHLGGGIDEQGATFGRAALKVPARRVPDAVVRLLRLYEERRDPGERARDFFRRIPDTDVRAAVAELLRIDEATATPDDFLDLGDAKSFEVATGPGECAS